MVIQDVVEGEANTTGDTTDNALPNMKLYLIAYVLLYITIGFLLAFPGTIYIRLKNDLGASTSTVSWIFSASAFAMIFSSVLSGAILDRLVETHRFLSVVTVCTVTALCLIPLIDDIPIMFILFVVIGAGNSANDTCGAVWIFRAWPQKGGLMFFALNTLTSGTMMLTPLLIQLSISETNGYRYPLWVIGGVAATYTVFIVFLETPKHDNLRSLKREVQKSISTESEPSIVDRDGVDVIDPTASRSQVPETSNVSELTRRASIRLQQDPQFKTLQYAQIGILILILTLHRAVESGMLLFITTFCVEYADIDESFGRYLMSIYSGSTLCHRVGYTVLSKYYDKEVDTVCKDVTIWTNPRFYTRSSCQLGIIRASRKPRSLSLLLRL